MARRKANNSKKLIEKYLKDPASTSIAEIEKETDLECWSCERFKLNEGQCFAKKSPVPCLAYIEIAKGKEKKAS